MEKNMSWICSIWIPLRSEPRRFSPGRSCMLKCGPCQKRRHNILMSESKNTKPVQSSSHDRRVVGYLRPCIAAKFERYLTEKGVNMSEAVNDAVQKLVEPMPPQQSIKP